MIAIKEFAPLTLEVRFEGRIAPDDIEKLENLTHPYLVDEGSVNAVIDLSKGADPLVEDPRCQARLLAQMDKFGRVALLGGSRAQGQFVQALEVLMPPGQMHQFGANDRQSAREFAAGTLDPALVHGGEAFGAGAGPTGFVAL
jgi:hypothetical protein